MVLELHNVYFMKKDFSEAQARAWSVAHKYKFKKKDLKQHEPDQWRYNQVPKQKFNPKSYVTKILPNKVHMIFGERK